MRKLMYLLAIASAAVGLAASAGAQEKMKMDVGTGSAKFNGLYQAWTVNDTTATNSKLNFKLRRAEFKFSGSFMESMSWMAMIDAAKSLRTGTISSSNDNKVLQELSVTYNLTNEFEFTAGQFKTLTTWEGLEPSAELFFPERSLTARTYGDRREPGMKAMYKSGPLKAGIMGSNGQGTNVDDTSDKKDISARVDYKATDMLLFGGFTSIGDFNAGTKSRWGLNARVALLDDLVLRAEGVRAVDHRVATNAWYVDGGYMITEKLRPVARFETIDKPLMAHQTSVGLNYYVSKTNAKIQASFAFLDNVSGGGGSPALSSGTDGRLFTLNFQAGI